MFSALGHFHDAALAQRALDLVLAKEQDVRDTLNIVYAALFARETRDTALAWLGKHLDELLARMRSDEASWVLAAIAGGFCDDAHVKTAGELVTARARAIEGAAAPVARASEHAMQCVAEATRQRPALERVFLAIK